MKALNKDKLKNIILNQLDYDRDIVNISNEELTESILAEIYWALKTTEEKSDIIVTSDDHPQEDSDHLKNAEYRMTSGF